MLIDSHAHMDLKDFDKDRREVIDRATSGGISHIISVGIDLKSSSAALNLAKDHPSIRAAVGFHPHDASECSPQALDALIDLASSPEVVAWGEIGLDYFRNYSPSVKQKEIFESQLALANDLDLPVIIHDRDAHDDILRTLKKMGRKDKAGVIHCFSGDTSLAFEFIDLGYYISIPGTVTYKKASRVKNVAKTIPIERLMIETDAPFLAPVPKRGKRNEPLFVTYTAQEIARLRKTDFETIAVTTSKNTKELFDFK